MEFEWDDNKEIYNIKKHSISFSMAARVFDDDNRIEFYDYEHSVSEDRYVTIGLVDGVFAVVFVVFTEREKVIRIISARLATRKEKERYFGDY